MLSNLQFDRTRRLASSLAGIELVERHRQLLEHRYRRIGVSDAAGLDALLAAAEEGEATATRRIVCVLTTKFTCFFRHPHQFEIAGQHALKMASRHGQARVWSAATATGEEAYSVALVLIEVFGADQPPVQVLGTDIDTQALEIARRGEYAEHSIKGLDLRRRERFFCEAVGSKRWAIRPAARRLVEFRVLNLIGLPWVMEGSFDVIFCRNVLMYLHPARRYAVLEGIASLLAPNGLLMLDPTEHLGSAEHMFRSHAGGVYSQRAAACSGPELKPLAAVST